MRVPPSNTQTPKCLQDVDVEQVVVVFEEQEKSCNTHYNCVLLRMNAYLKG